MKNNWFDKANLWIRSVEGSFLNFLSLITPFAVSLIPAAMIFNSLQSHIGFNFGMALISGFVIEALGLTTLHTLVQFWHHNRKYGPAELEKDASPQARAAAKKKEDRLMPINAAIISYAFYVIVVLVLNVLLDIQTLTQVEVLARALLCLLPIPSGIMMTTRTLYTEMLFDIEREKANRIVANKIPVTPVSDRKVAVPFDDWRKVPENHRRMIARLKPKQVQEKYEIPERTSRLWVQYAEKEFGSDKNNGTH